MKVDIHTFIAQQYHPDCAPSEATVRMWIKRKKLPYPVEKIGRVYYIDLSQKRSNNPLVDKVLTR